MSPAKPMSAAELRRLFLIDPQVAFLNHGSFGACPRPVFEVYQAWQRELELEPVAFLGRRFPELMADARSRLADYVGADPLDLVYVPNATTGVNIVARSLDLGPGDEVLVTDHIYGACDRTWRFVGGRAGATVRHVSIDLPVTTHEEVVEKVWSAVNERTKLIFLSHITSVTGLVLPVRELCRRAREAGVLCLVDGAHAPGQIDLDVADVGADFYTGNCHKWLCAPKGAAFLHARREVQPLLEPLVVSWGYEAEEPGPSRFVDEHEYTGTRDIAAYLAVPAAIDFQEQHDWPAVRERCHELLRETRARLLEMDGFRAIHPDQEGWYCQMEAVEIPQCDDDAVKMALFEQYSIEALVRNWGDRSILRVSIQGYNTRQDVERLLDALPRVLG
jgi:isopenicillin-N epimerase